MVRHLVLQLVRSAGVILLVTFASFSLMYADSRGIAESVLGIGATDDAIDAKMTDLGLDRPLLVQYVDWLGGALTGDLGRSFYTSESVNAALGTRAPVTLIMITITLLLTAVVSVVLGVTAAVRGGWADRLVQVLSVLGAAIPPYVIAIVLVMVLAVQWHLFPATGYVPPVRGISPWLLSISLPVVALFLSTVAGSASQFRNATLDVLSRDYVRTLRARGIKERDIIFRHVLRNAAPPGFTSLSLTMIGLLGGTVFVEQVFALPGLGQLANQAAQDSDVPVVMGAVLVTILVVLAVNFLSDLGISAINPKARTR